MFHYKLTALLFFILVSSVASAQSTRYEFTISKDGTGDFETIQAAIDEAKAFPPKRITLYIKNGIYKEKVKVHAWNTKLSLIGEDVDKTIISWDDHFSKIDKGRNSTFYTYTMLVEGDDFYAENLTIENSSGAVGQAVALHINADRVEFNSSKFLGNQDTIYLSGEGKRQYFNNCYIEGTTDFIFGAATAVFNKCEIYSKKDSYITAASTPKGVEYGFVFKNCSLTAAQGISKVYLGRPWREHAKTVFLSTEMGEHIRPEGWHNWGKKEAERLTFYAAYNNSGPGFLPNERVKWSHLLSPEEAENYETDDIFKGWNPKNN